MCDPVNTISINTVWNAARTSDLVKQAVEVNMDRLARHTVEQNVLPMSIAQTIVRKSARVAHSTDRFRPATLTQERSRPST